MTKILISTLLLLSFIRVNAQHKVYFEPKLSAAKTPHSLYNSITLLDSRPDTSFGFVKTGAFNRTAAVFTKHPLKKELTSVFSSLTDADVATNGLLLHLRQFSFAELTRGMSEIGYCTFRADLYAQKLDKFQRVASIDTVFTLRSSIDVTNGLLEKGRDTLTGFIQSNLLRQPADTVMYSYNDVAKMDSIEKRKITVYTTSVYNDGLYLNFQSFKAQIPDKAITVTSAYPYAGNVKALDDKGKLRDIKLNKTYALVYKGEPYVVTSFGLYLLKKVNDDFFFTGKAKVTASTGTMIVSSMFGLLGGLLTSGSDEATFDMKIDHKNGALIKLKEIAEKPAPESKGDAWD
ncbi:hypothetical protein A0256_15295 [Mucilaginibacter sp. PAMC 26640]|nr:hypothetical protein A0256_15295 [Mucilaginibacter sp. PAMC 26640]